MSLCDLCVRTHMAGTPHALSQIGHVSIVIIPCVRSGWFMGWFRPGFVCVRCCTRFDYFYRCDVAASMSAHLRIREPRGREAATPRSAFFPVRRSYDVPIVKKHAHTIMHTTRMKSDDGDETKVRTNVSGDTIELFPLPRSWFRPSAQPYSAGELHRLRTRRPPPGCCRVPSRRKPSS